MQDYPFTDAEMTTISGAYEAITRVGNETAVAGQWDDILDRAHQGLGVIIAVKVARDWQWRKP